MLYVFMMWFPKKIRHFQEATVNRCILTAYANATLIWGLERKKYNLIVNPPASVKRVKY
jgi:hypothetical protein